MPSNVLTETFWYPSSRRIVAARARELVEALERVDRSRQARQDRRLVSRAGSDLQHLLAGFDGQALRHETHHRGLRDRLAEPDRKRVVAVGLRPERLRARSGAAAPRSIAARTRGSSTPRVADVALDHLPAQSVHAAVAGNTFVLRGHWPEMVARWPAASEANRESETGRRIKPCKITVSDSSWRFNDLTPRETAELVQHPTMAGVSREELKKWYALMHLARVLDDKAPNYLKQGLGLELPRPLRRPRRHPARPRDDLPARAGLPLPLLPRPDDLRGRRPDRRRDPPERDVQGRRRRLGRPAHVQPLRQARDRDPERLVLRRQPRAARGGSRPGDQDLRQGLDRLLFGRRVVDLRGVLLRGRERLLAREAAGRLRHPGQRLRDLGAQDRPDGEPDCLRQLLAGS